MPHPDGDKHHYIPKFYLKQWTGDDGKLCEFSIPFNTVRPRRTVPDSTGYQRGLYTFRELPPQAAHFLEGQFLLHADDGAFNALSYLLRDDLTLSPKMKDAWTRFLMTLFHRTPEGVARLKQENETRLPVEIEEFRPQYENLRQANSPTFEEFRSQLTEADYQAILLKTLHKLMDSQLVGRLLNSMLWGTIQVESARFPMLTSDRPIIMSNGLRQPGAHLIIPISPCRAFALTDTQETAHRLQATGSFVERVNDLVVRQARRFVYGTDDRQLRFVANRLGQKIKWSPIE